MSSHPWTGTWVGDRLGVVLRTGYSATGLELRDLVGLAVRRNPRRAHLLVSTVLGKHVPTDPALVLGAGHLLGVLVGQILASQTPDDVVGGRLMRAALAGKPGAALALLQHCQDTPRPALSAGAVVLGYAETATGLAHCVASQLRTTVLHSTRRPVTGVARAAGFEEEHSHASSHLLLPADPGLLAGADTLVLVDDELSTGTTVANTIRALHATRARDRYVIAALVDLRDEDNRERTHALADELGCQVEVLALAAGTVHLPPGVLAAGAILADSIPALTAQTPSSVDGVLTRCDTSWPSHVPDGGRHGLTPAQDDQLVEAARALAVEVAAGLDGASRVHVLAVEEFMYAPLLLADALAALTTARVTYSTTTRSPVLVQRDRGYAIASGITFPAHDDPADGPGPRYAYNIPQQATVVLVTDDAGDTAALHAPDGLLARLRATAPHVVLVTIPSHRPTPTEDTV